MECFGKSRAGRKQHDMSHLFHGLLINLIRRSDCQSIRPPAVEDGTDDLEDDWKTWAEAEQKKRYFAIASPKGYTAYLSKTSLFMLHVGHTTRSAVLSVTVHVRI